MEDQLYLFDPGTITSKCPMPTIFDYFLKTVPKVEQYISLHTQEDIININHQLDETQNLIISNIIQRVIAQIIGQTSDGFVTIKGTDDGELHVYIAGSDTAAPLHILIDAGTNLIGKIQIQGSSQTPLKAVINFATAATHDIIAAVSGVKHKITTIVFTVAGDTNITLKDEDGNFTGAMDFGGTNEPRGFVSNHAQITMNCGTNKKFQIINSAAVQVSGYVLYYDEA